MRCLECGREDNQNWCRGYPQTLETPAEPAGWECGYCGHEYAEDAEAKADWEYDARRDDDEDRI